MSMRLVLSALLGLLITVAMATDGRADDLQVWTSVGSSWSPFQHLEVQLEPQLRFDQNVSRTSEILVDAEVRYRIVRGLRLGVGYRAGYERDGDGDLMWRHRLHGDLEPRADIGHTRFSYRLRFQEKWRPGSRDAERASVRNRLEVSYRGWSPWVPQISGELFHALGGLTAPELSKIRVTLGTAFKLDERSDLEVFYRIELSNADQADPTLHILGLSYQYDLAW